MNMTPLIRDLKVFALVSLFYLALLLIIGLARRARSGPGASLKRELAALFANKNFIWVYSAVYLFTATYAVKNVAARIVLMFLYVAFVFKLVKADLDSRKRP